MTYQYRVVCAGYKTKDGYPAHSSDCAREWLRQTTREYIPGTVSHGICPPCAKLSLQVSIDTIVAHQLKKLDNHT